MRALTATIVTTLFISTACVGGPGSPPDPDDDAPIDQGQTGGPREGERPNRDEEPAMSTPPGPPSRPAACAADQCAPVKCTCNDVEMSIQRCIENRCVTSCTEAGCP